MPSIDAPFANQTLLITGGLGGIGGDVARHLMNLGAHVVVSARPGSDRSAVEALGDRASFTPLDVTSEQSWKAAIDGVVQAHGAINGLVNVAGVFIPGIQFEDMTLAQWRQHMDVNLDGSFMGCSLAMKAMSKTGGGSIVNVSSGMAQIMMADAGAYCVSKAAVLALTRLAAKAGGKYRVRVNAILPGAIETPMLWRNLQDGQDTQVLTDMIVSHHPIGRMGQTDDVARAAAFLLDPANSFVTGALLAVDGGQMVN